MDLRVEYTYDQESDNWCFRVPALHIIGGADTREDAAAQALAVIEFTLEAYRDDVPSPDAESEFLKVTVERR